MKIDRLLGILHILTNRERITIQELAERFEVSKRTIFRDIDTLSQSGIPIITYPGIGGGVSLIEGYKYKKGFLSKADIQNIFTALSGLMSVNKNSELVSLMAKILPEETNNLFSESDYLIDLSSWFKDSITQKKISTIHSAIKDSKCISIEYISKNSRDRRIIHPYKLVFKQSYWYVYGYCENKEGFRLFKVNRIVSFDILNRTFNKENIEEFNLINDFGTPYQKTKVSNTSYEVKLEYDMINEFLLTDKIEGGFFHREGSEKTGYIIFEISNLDLAADFIVSLQNKVKVIAPLELKEKVKLRIETLVSLYKDDI